MTWERKERSGTPSSSNFSSQRKCAVSTHPQLSVFGTEGKWRMFRKSRNIFGRTKFSAIIVWQQHKANHSVHTSDVHKLRGCAKALGFIWQRKICPRGQNITTISSMLSSLITEVRRSRPQNPTKIKCLMSERFCGSRRPQKRQETERLRWGTLKHQTTSEHNFTVDERFKPGVPKSVPRGSKSSRDFRPTSTSLYLGSHYAWNKHFFPW